MCNQMMKQVNMIQFQAFKRITIKGSVVVPSYKFY